MSIRPYLLKFRSKYNSIKKGFQPPMRVLPTAQFFKAHWKGPEPDNGYFRDRTYPRFYFSVSNLDGYRSTLEKYLPQAYRDITWKAANAAAHRCNILGTGEIDLGEKIDWHRDYKSGKRWEKKPFAKMQIVNPADDSDVKIPWEISRLQFLNDLGRGFLVSGNLALKREFKAILKDWEESNPVDIGVNWTCSMEVAIRAINIIWGLHFFDYDKFETDFIRNIIKLLYYHGCHIENNLEIIGDGANTNHLLSDYIGLFYLGLLFPEFDRAAHWKKMAIEGLEKGIAEQVHKDGADYECSTSYHRLVFEIFLSAFVLGRLNGITFSERYKARLYAMISFSESLIPSSGQAPLIGDNDDGFIVRLAADNPADHRHLVEVGLLLFGERVPVRFKASEERLWYLGPAAMAPYVSYATPSSKLYRDSGYAVVRNDSFHMVCNIGGIPGKNLGGHKHNDLLALTLEINGTQYLIDPGTYCYTANYPMRNLSRSTGMHNTIAVDGYEQNRYPLNRLFYMMPDAKPRVHLWTDLGNSVVISASHDGYSRLNDKIIHKRTISAMMEGPSVLVSDELTGRPGTLHRFRMVYITPQREIEQLDNSSVVMGRKRFGNLKLRGSSEGLRKMTIEPVEYFPRYGVMAQGNKVVFEYEGFLPFKISTTMAYGANVFSAVDQLRRAEGELISRFGVVLR